MKIVMKYMVLVIAFLSQVWANAQTDTIQKIIKGRTNSTGQQAKPYVIMISADGFRFDYPELHQARCLLSIEKKGVRADYMMPAYPTLTFPNHYTLVTGMYPSHHGLVDNHFFDPSFQEKYGMSNKKQVMDHRWYGGYPLWVLAEQQKMLSASFYWVGTEAPIQGIQPTYYFNYNEKIPISRRIQTVVDWLQLPAEQRPHFISFYFPEVDHAGHSYGPESVKTGESVRFVDSVICQLTEAVNKTGLDVNYIFVSDHGMARVDTTRYVYIPAVDTSRAVLVWGGELAQVYVKSPSDIPALYQELAGVAKDYRVILKKDMPARLHYGAKDDVYNRIGDILLIPLKGFTFIARGRKPKAGAHGYDPFLVPEMQSVFFAWGPAFKKGKRISAIKNVDVFPVVASILGLEYQHKIDGNKKLMRKILIR